MRKKLVLVTSIICALTIGAALLAQPKKSVLTNAAVVSMVKGGMPDSLVVSTIHSSETQFDVSAGALAELKKSGVSQKVSDAMVAAESRKRGAAQPSKTAVVAARGKAPSTQQPPYAQLVQGAARQNLTVEKTQIAQANTKSQDLNTLAVDAAVMQALQGVVGGLAEQAGSKISSATGGRFGEIAGGLTGGLFKKRKPTVMYLWALPGQTASSAVPTNTPAFEIFYNGIPGVNPAEYVPTIVRLVPARNEWLLVGAAKGQTEALQSSNADWEIYSSFIEEKIPTKLNQSAPGQAQVEPAKALEPGEYGLVLRPVSKNKKFSGTALSNNQGEGLLFNLVWAFSVAGAAPAQ